MLYLIRKLAELLCSFTSRLLCLARVCATYLVDLQPELHGMLPVEGGAFTGLQQTATRWPEQLKTAVAVCNSLTLVNKTQVVGDLADKQAFTAVEARFLVCSLPT